MVYSVGPFVMTSIFHEVELFSLRSTVFSSEKGNEKHHKKGQKRYSSVREKMLN